MTDAPRHSGWSRTPAARHGLFLVGCLLILLSPAVGILPGPGGVFVFAAGVALLLRTSIKAKRGYVRLKRRWPKLGTWVDWGLRRGSAKRRRLLSTHSVTPAQAGVSPGRASPALHKDASRRWHDGI